ncbi:MAG: hypothetical protein R2865_12270 [Deinococcales bacterium]
MTASQGYSQALAVSGSIQAVHDPVMIETEGQYYLYSTGTGISIRCSMMG